MSKRNWLESLEQIGDHRTKVEGFIRRGGMAWLRDGFAGHPRSPSFDAGESTSKPPRDDDPSKPKEYLPPDLRGREDRSDPTAAAAVSSLNYGDKAATDARRLGKVINAMDQLAAEAAQIVERWTPRIANAIEKQEDTAQPGCASCARVASPGTVGLSKRDQTPWWNEVARSVTLASGVKVDLCEWCRAQARATGELPATADVESYRDTGRARKRTA